MFIFQIIVNYRSYCVKNKTVPDINLCCYGKLCPDEQTPFFYEPKCSGYDESNSKSGECPAIGAMCRFGHCCPKAEVNSTGYLNKPEYSYRTNQSCTPEVRPLQFLGGYCDPVLGMMVIIGNLSTDEIHSPLIQNHVKLMPIAQWMIQNCAFMKRSLRIPLLIVIIIQRLRNRQVTKKDATYLIIFIVVVVLIFIALAAFIGDSVFYRLKLKNKKNVTKKKGKNKKKPEKKGKKDKKTSKTPTTPTTPTTSKSTSPTGKTRSGVSSGGSPSII